MSRNIQNEKGSPDEACCTCSCPTKYWAVFLNWGSAVAHIPQSRIYIFVSHKVKSIDNLRLWWQLNLIKLSWASTSWWINQCFENHQCSHHQVNSLKFLGLVALLGGFLIIQPPAVANILSVLTLILLTWRIWWASNNANRWQKGFNSQFKGLMKLRTVLLNCMSASWTHSTQYKVFPYRIFLILTFLIITAKEVTFL